MRNLKGTLDTYLELSIAVKDQEAHTISYELYPIQQIHPEPGKITGYTADLILGSRASGTAICIKLLSLTDLVQIRDFLYELGDSWAEKLEALEGPTDG